MKRPAIFIIIVLVVVFSIFVKESLSLNTPDTDDIVAFWRFNECGNKSSPPVVLDSSKHNNNGVVTGAKWGKGKDGCGLVFDGNDYVRVDDSDSLDVRDGITIEAWINLDGFSQEWNNIVRKNVNPLEDRYNLRVGGCLCGGEFILNIGGGLKFLFFPYNFESRRWYHIAAQYDGTQMKVFVNGELISSLSTSGPIASDGSDLYIGVGHLTTSEFYRGKMDEVKISSIALY